MCARSVGRDSNRGGHSLLPGHARGRQRAAAACLRGTRRLRLRVRSASGARPPCTLQCCLPLRQPLAPRVCHVGAAQRALGVVQRWEAMRWGSRTQHGSPGAIQRCACVGSGSGLPGWRVLGPRRLQWQPHRLPPVEPGIEPQASAPSSCLRATPGGLALSVGPRGPGRHALAVAHRACATALSW